MSESSQPFATLLPMDQVPLLAFVNSWTHKYISSNTNLHININKKSNNSLLDPEKAMSYGKRQKNLSKLDMLRA